MEERDRHENSQSEGFFNKEILSNRGLISLILQNVLPIMESLSNIVVEEFRFRSIVIKQKNNFLLILHGCLWFAEESRN